MAIPTTAADVRAYLGPDVSWDDSAIQDALAAETAAQAAVCRIPDPCPADLVEALLRRVAHNLAVRALPLGVQASIAEGAIATNYVGGTDAEVRRLEAPHRKRVVG